MDPVAQWQRQWLDFIQYLRLEGFLDDQFAQLRNLQDENSPDFVVEVVSLFFEDSMNLLNNMACALGQKVVDYNNIDAYVHQFKGSSASIGAARVKSVCITFRNCCEAKSLDGCLRCFQQVQQECSSLKNNLEKLFMLERQIIAAGGSVPQIE